MSKYTFGKCLICKQFKPLKDGICKECRERDIGLPPEFEELFGQFNNNTNKGKDG